jgi:spermidine synthase
VALRSLSLALLSAASLLLEITLTRLFSAVYYPPYVFAILSLAVLGIGLGAAVVTWRPALRQESYQPFYSIAAALSVLVILIALAFGLQGVIFVLVILPYFFIGLTFASIFSRNADRSGLLYMADLVGAGIGAVLAIPLMNALGPINSALVAVVMLTLVGLYPLLWRGLQTVSIVVALLLLVANLGFSWLKLDYSTLNTAKPIQSSLQTGKIIETRWDSFARTDLVNPQNGESHRLYIDGAAASIMPPPDDISLIRNIGFFPFATNQPPRVLLIGPGGGLDVWFALHGNAQEITAVEVNPASVDIVREYAAYNGSLYAHPSVRVLVDEGRSVLRRESTLYDLIFLSQVVTLTSERIGHALTENTIYTVEAFQDYLDHLTPKGYIALTLYDEATLTRALSTALATFLSRGLSDAEAIRHMAVFLDPQTGRPTPLLMIGSEPFTRDDSLVYGAIARDVGFTALYLPEALAQPPLDAIEAGTREFSEVVAESESDISPSTDNHPFFYQFERGLPADLQPLVLLMGGILAVGGVLLVFTQRQNSRLFPIYFAALGAGFMLVEIAVIQQTRLFLGHPTLAVTTTLAVLLVGGGIGSWLAECFALSSPRLPVIGIVAILMLWLVVWPLLSQNLLGQPTLVRILVTVVSLLPLALLIGMPFPLGLKRSGKISENQVALAWAVNGVMTVAGMVGAMALATISGFNSVLIAGLVAYLVAALLAYLISR